MRILGTVVDIYQNEDGSYGAITLDDGSDTIRGKFFQDLGPINEIEEGDIVDVIGKVKKYEGEIYITPENLIKRKPEWELLRALEYKEFKEKWKGLIEKAKNLKEKGKTKDDIYNELKAENLSEEDIKGIMDFMENEKDIKEGEEPSKREPDFEEDEKSKDKQKKHEEGSEGKIEEKVLEVIEEKDSGDGADYSEIISKLDVEEEKLEDTINDLLSDGTCYEPRPGKIKKL